MNTDRTLEFMCRDALLASGARHCPCCDGVDFLTAPEWPCEWDLFSRRGGRPLCDRCEPRQRTLHSVMAVNYSWQLFFTADDPEAQEAIP